MRRLLPLVALLALTNVCSAQFTENFDGFNVGDLCYQATCANAAASDGWDGWFGDPLMAGIVTDGTVSGIAARSGTQYLDVTGRDAVLPMIEIVNNAAYAAASGASITSYPQSGAWTVTGWAYVPTGGVGVQGQQMGWFILNSNYVHTGAAGTAWAAQVQFYDDGAGTLMVNDANGSNGALATTYDAWHEIRFEVCLDNNTCQSYLDGVLLGDRIWTATLPAEIANIDLFSSADGAGTLFGQIFFDDISLVQQTSCPTPDFQINSAVSSLDLDGAVGSPFAPAQVLGFAGSSTHTMTLTSSLIGTGFDLGFVAGPAVASNAGGLATANGQAFNLDILNPSLIWLNSPGAALPGLTTPHPGTLPIPFGAPPVGLPLTISAQQVVLDPGHPDFIALSAPAELNIEVCPTGVDVDFEAPNWGAPNTFAAGWTFTDSNPMAANTWQVRTGTTPSGGTGPSGAAEGAQYIYYESSCPNTTGACGAAPPGPNVSTLESPPSGHANALSTLAVINPALIFRHHALGNFAGDFRVEQFNPTTMAWDVIFSFSGAQSTSAADWRVVKANLNNHGTGDVQIRFVHDGGPNSTWQSDWCLDALSICEQ